MNPSKRNKNFHICAVLSGVVLFSLFFGCINIATTTDTGGSDEFDNSGETNDPTGDTLAVTLIASNTNPQVSEEVTLTCTINSGLTNDSGQMIDPVFAFQPTDRLISIDTTNGTAIFLIDETDTGIEFVFTCTVTDANTIDVTNPNTTATSDPSPPVSIIPTATVVP